MYMEKMEKEYEICEKEKKNDSSVYMSIPNSLTVPSSILPLECCLSSKGLPHIE